MIEKQTKKFTCANLHPIPNTTLRLEIFSDN
jgi:hypothetical protein